MFANMAGSLDFNAQALVLRAERQRVIASNIANADTPGYVARDLNFKDAMTNAIGGGLNANNANSGTMHPQHIALGNAGFGGSSTLAYVAQTQPSLDGNSVDLDRERASFVDNAVRYEATLRFINSDAKIILSAIQGQ
jgi:flagellar basal-body rod protein FlgB